jgi:hemerythrin-like metal-binding protein
MKTSDLVWQDTQHRYLFRMLDQLKQSGEIHINLLDSLNDYVVHHFSLEEKYMRITHFPQDKMEPHLRAHRMFERKVANITKSRSIVSQGLKSEQFRRELGEFLEDWLVTHVMGLDKELEDHVMKSDIK